MFIHIRKKESNNLTTYTSKSNSNSRIFDLILTAMLISLVFVATFFITIKLPIAAKGGIVHFGTAMLFIAAILFGPKKGTIAGAVGMALFDLISGWTLWAPFTFVARGIQGYIVGQIAWSNNRKGSSVIFNLIAMIVSIPFMLAGYYICELVLFNSWVIPLGSIPGNITQNILGICVAIPVCIVLKKIPLFK